MTRVAACDMLKPLAASRAWPARTEDDMTNPQPEPTTAPAPPVKPRLDDIPEPLLRLIREQGVAETATYENLLGSGKDLWESDEEFEEWMELLRKLKREG